MAEGEAKATVADDRPDRLLAGFASVWVWTVLFGINGGLSYSYATAMGSPILIELMVRRNGGAGVLGLPVEVANVLMLAIPALFVGGFLASLAAWGFLYVYFSAYLLPIVLRLQPVGSPERRTRIAASALKRAYLLLICAGVARMLPEVAMAVLSLARVR